jgi:hypothetical protein
MNAEPTSPLLHLAQRADLGVFLGRWSYQPTLEELPAAYEAITTAALAGNCRFWLQDIRRRTLNDPHTTDWLLTEYFPDMARRLGGRLYIAYLVSPALHQHILTYPGYLPASGYDGQPFVVAFFGDDGAAVQWLQAEQAREQH